MQKIEIEKDTLPGADLDSHTSSASIKRYYRASCIEMDAHSSSMVVDFRTVQMEDKNYRIECKRLVDRAATLLSNAQEAERKVAAEYENFMATCSRRRMEAALGIADEMQSITKMERLYRNNYNNAKKEFMQLRALSGPAFISATGSKVTSNQHMRDIEKKAAADLQRKGALVKESQAAEANLILTLRQEQFVVHELLKLWGQRHLKSYNRLVTAYHRMQGLLVDYERAHNIRIKSPHHTPDVHSLLKQVLQPMIE